MTRNEQEELYRQLEKAIGKYDLWLERRNAPRPKSEPFIYLPWKEEDQDTGCAWVYGSLLDFEEDDIVNSRAAMFLFKAMENLGGFWWIHTPVYFEGKHQPQKYGVYWHRPIDSYHGRENQCHLGDSVIEAAVHAFIKAVGDSL